MAYWLVGYACYWPYLEISTWSFILTMLFSLRIPRIQRLFLLGVALILTLSPLWFALLPGIPLKSSLLAAFEAKAANLMGFAPRDYKDGMYYGSGVYFAPHRVEIHEGPSEASPLLESFSWGGRDASSAFGGLLLEKANRETSLHNVFLCYYPKLEVAMMAVSGESAGLLPDGSENTDLDAPLTWVEVVYDQKQNKRGWVKVRDNAMPADTSMDNSPVKTVAATAEGSLPHLGVYQSWMDFMRLNAKPLGVYWLSGVKQYHRSLRMSDEDEAGLIPVMIIRDMKVKYVRGNWLLVEVLDFEHNTPIGWIRWRDDEGNLMLFPNLSQEKPPVVITGM
ncbi:MAG: hypothetical protein VKJ04_01765 [Vampirovibrionales bacterium]|nr:hypothetical protein [Vampirovibrionales bacterium]